VLRFSQLCNVVDFVAASLISYYRYANSIRITAIGEVGTIRATGYPGT
jgi:hypothetical protein